jgi:putative acetyltransferase
MKREVETATETDYDVLTEVWEASVRATHDFLTEGNIQYFKPLVRNDYLKLVELRCIRNEAAQPIGFLGVADGKIEMLFIHPEARGKGVGRQLLEYAIHQMQATELDVNEQNEQAVGFYKRMNFVVVGRSEVDSLGMPFPLLKMKYAG